MPNICFLVLSLNDCIGRVIPTRRTAGVTISAIPTTPTIPPLEVSPFIQSPAVDEEEVDRHIDKYGIGFG